jgi:hypothetical protein
MCIRRATGEVGFYDFKNPRLDGMLWTRSQNLRVAGLEYFVSLRPSMEIFSTQMMSLK